MLEQRQVAPGWADDPVQGQEVYRWGRCQGRRGMTPLEGHQTEVG